MSRKFVAGLFATYVVLLLFVSWWPFRFHFGSGPVAHIEWPPFRFLAPEYWGDGKSDVLKIVTFVPLGLLLAITTAVPVNGLTVIRRSLLAGASLNLLIQIGWLFLPGRTVSASDLVLSLIGTLAGASPIGFCYLPGRLLGFLTMVYAATFLVAATWPWHFSLEALNREAFIRRIEWIPFGGRILRMWVLKEGALNSLITIPLGLLAASWVLRNGGKRRQALTTAAFMGLGCSLIVECLQYFLPTRTPSLGDLGLNSLGALLGGVLAYYLESWWLKEHPLETGASSKISTQ